MIRARRAFLIIVFCPILAAATVLDDMIWQLEQRRAAKAEALAECEKEEKKFMAWGISTLAATGAGIYANIKLHEKLSNMSGGGARGSRERDTRPQKEKDADSCELLCELGIAPATCGC